MSMEPIRVELKPHHEKLARENPFLDATSGQPLLYHQWRTYQALQSHALIVNTYNTGTGKTRAALLHLLDPEARTVNMLFVAPTNELIVQHQRDIETFLERAKLEYHVVRVDAQTLRALPGEYERVGERLNRLFQNPREYGWDGRKPLAVVTNPDIFYYALYFSAYHPHDRRNLFEQFMLRFDYVVIDEFHYYVPKQLAAFLFYFVICREWGYFKKGRKICLLSATPEPEVIEYLHRVFAPDEMAIIAPATEPSESNDLPMIPALAPISLEIHSFALDEYVAMPQTQTQLQNWILHEGLDGALISSALWRINLAHATLKPSLDKQMARITGAEKIAQRRDAPQYPLVLATPTVDIGYNFDKPKKTRQPLDFVLYDARTHDQFLQRLGRAGRVLGKQETDIPARAIALLDVADEAWTALRAIDGQLLERRTLTQTILNTLPARGDLYSYMQSYAIAEVLRPMFNLKQMLRPDLHAWLEQLFEGVRSVFAPSSSRWTFKSIEAVMRRHENLERIVRKNEYQFLKDFLNEYVDWNKWSLTPEQHAKLARGVMIEGRVRDVVLNWVESQYWLTEALFNFREALDTPTACVFDPKHLLANSDVTVYDALHVAMNYDIEWFANSDEFAARTNQVPAEALVYARLLDHCATRLWLSFEYVAPSMVDAERFLEVYCRRPIMLKGLVLRAELRDGSGPFPLEGQIRHVFQDQFVPILAIPDKTREAGILRLRLRDTNLFPRALKVRFEDESEGDYLILVGTAVFTVQAEMERFFWMQERKESTRPIFA